MGNFCTCMPLVRKEPKKEEEEKKDEAQPKRGTITVLEKAVSNDPNVKYKR